MPRGATLQRCHANVRANTLSQFPKPGRTLCDTRQHKNALKRVSQRGRRTLIEQDAAAGVDQLGKHRNPGCDHWQTTGQRFKHNLRKPFGGGCRIAENIGALKKFEDRLMVHPSVKGNECVDTQGRRLFLELRQRRPISNYVKMRSWKTTEDERQTLYHHTCSFFHILSARDD